MRFLKSRFAKLLGACLLFWIIGAIIIFNRSLRQNTLLVSSEAIILLIAVLLTIACAVIFIIKTARREPNKDNFAQSVTAKVLSSLLMVAILTSLGTAIRSLWFSPLGDDYSSRFTYENIATITGFIAIGSVIILSAIQKHIYWVTQKATVTLDERQLQERRKVFETSYKVLAFLSLLSVWWLCTKLWQIPIIIANNHGFVPDQLYWMGINFVVFIFGLPLVLAAWYRSFTRKTNMHQP